MKRSYIFVSLLLLMSIVDACGPYSPPKNSRSSNPLELAEQVIYKDLNLKLWVHVRNVSQDRVNDLLVAKIMLENKKGSDMPIEIKAKWLDKDGYEVKDAWGMRPVMLKGYEVTTQEFIAPDPGAVSVRFVISKPE